jgi:hypothetical protein
MKGGVTPSKRRREQATTPVDAPGASSQEGGVLSPLEASLAPGWEQVIQSLCELTTCDVMSPAQLARLSPDVMAAVVERYAALGGKLVRVLQRSFELHHLIHADDDEPAPLTPADLVLMAARCGSALRPIGASLDERVAAVNECAHRSSSDALERRRHRRPDAAGGHGAMHGGPPTAAELMGEERWEGGAAGEADPGSVQAFRDAYMALLADGAADELDSLRRDEPPMDEAALGMLVDALEAGASTFGTEQRRLVSASFVEGAGEQQPRSLVRAKKKARRQPEN